MTAALLILRLVGLQSGQLTGGQNLPRVFAAPLILVMSQVRKNRALRLRHFVGASFLKKWVLAQSDLVRIDAVRLMVNGGLAFFRLIYDTSLHLTTSLLGIRRCTELKVIARWLQDAAFLSQDDAAATEQVRVLVRLYAFFPRSHLTVIDHVDEAELYTSHHIRLSRFEFVGLAGTSLSVG